MSGYYLLMNGEFAYNKSYSVGYDFGSIKRLDRYPMGTLSTLYICFALKQYNSDFIKVYFDSLKWYREIYMIAAEGARNHGLLNVPTEDFFETRHTLPMNIAEQQKIASFINLLDERIAKQRELVESLKKYKRGLSDAIFEAIAEMETSVVSSFDNVFTLLQNNTFSRDELSFDNGGVKNIHYGDVLIKYGAVLDMSSTQVTSIKPSKNLDKYSSSSYLHNGDVVFADTAEDYSVGKATEIYNADGMSVLSGLHTIPCRSNMKFAPMYLGYFFNSSYFKSQIYPMIQGTKVSSISKSEIRKTMVLVPLYSIQEKTAAVLRKLDSRIENEEKTVAALIQVKHGLLQRLFI